MKDFDAERKIREDRSFRIGGKDFHFRPSVQQEKVDLYFDSLSNIDLTNAETLKVCDELILAGLDEECADDWRAVRAVDAPIPLMSKNIHDVIGYMLEVMLDRPTESPSDSGGTPKPTGTSLTDKSQEPVESS